jgi:hypothetical protein
MTMFLNSETPFLRILDPATGAFIRFNAGRLDLDPETEEGAYWLPLVVAEASHNASIRAIESAVFCPECGEPFTGGTAKANLAVHRRSIHFDAFMRDVEASQAEERNVLIAGQAGYPCGLCPPGMSTFGNEQELAIHTRALHTQAPALDGEGNTIGGGEVDVTSSAPTMRRGRQPALNSSPPPVDQPPE